MRKTGIAMLLIAGAMVSAGPVEAQVSVNVNIGPPPVIFAAPPRVLVVPHTPVYYAPDTTYNVFFYEGRYYSFHNGAWFLAGSHGGPWAFVPLERVPRPVVMVPVRYYKIPPGQAKKMMAGDHDGGHKGGDKHGHGRGNGHGNKKHDR
jgi:hypothetical protein